MNMRNWRHWLAALLLVLLGTGVVAAQNFPKLSGRVVDAANLLSPEQEAQLTQLSTEIEQASSRQLVVATVPDLQDHPIEDYGYRLGRAWKIGQQGASNGIILLVAPKERKVRIEVGYGLEPIMTDALAGTIIRDTILPRFRDGDMAGGIMAGSQEIAAQMKLPLEAAEARAKQKIDAAAKSGGRKKKDGVGPLVGIFWAIVFFAIVVPMILGGRRGRRYRGGGSGIMPIILWSALDAATRSRGGGGWGGGGGGGGSGWGGGGGFSGGGGSFGGGGASGGW
ncbi:MAG: TPM domain-containing protein [Sphingomonas sp.]